MPDQRGFDSPEAAALAGWATSPGAHVRVISITVRGDRAEVIIDTEPSHPDFVYCVRREGEWFETVSGNAPTVGWDDPAVLGWD